MLMLHITTRPFNIIIIIITIKQLHSLKCFVLQQGRHTNEMPRKPNTRERTFARNHVDAF
jgi:hypothetical protein